MARQQTDTMQQLISDLTTTLQEPKQQQPTSSSRIQQQSASATEPLLGEQDLFLFNEGTHLRLHEKLGAHPFVMNGAEGTYFAVWAPDAEQVSVMGEFNDWNKTSHLLQPKGQSGLMYAQPGKKLLFMGGEFGQWREWNHDAGLDWHLLEQASHVGLQRWVEDLNRLYRSEPALYERDCDGAGFAWIDCNDTEQSVVSFLRQGRTSEDTIVVVCNFTPVLRHNYQVGVPHGGFWRESLNSDAEAYGGSHQGNLGGMAATLVSVHGHAPSLLLTLPPLGIVFFKTEREKG